MNSEQLKALSEATNGDVYDHEWEGGVWMCSATETHETLDEFVESSRSWAERSAPREGTIAGLPFIAWRNVQAARGKVRGSLSVIDFGDIRVVVTEDLTNYI